MGARRVPHVDLCLPVSAAWTAAMSLAGPAARLALSLLLAPGRLERLY